MLRDVVVFRLFSAHAPAIHAASHSDHEKRVAWFSTSMLACGSAPIVVVLSLAARRAPLLTVGMINEPIRYEGMKLLCSFVRFSQSHSNSN